MMWLIRNTANKIVNWALGHNPTHEDGGVDEISLTGLAGSEIRLTPKASSTGAEGTIFYDSDDDHIWVATE